MLLTTNTLTTYSYTFVCKNIVLLSIGLTSKYFYIELQREVYEILLAR